MLQAQVVNIPQPRRDSTAGSYSACLIAAGLIVAVTVLPTMGLPRETVMMDIFRDIAFFAAPISMLLLWCWIKVQQARARARWIEQLDPVTAMPKRSGFIPKLSRALPQAGVLLVADIDDFKALKEQYGVEDSDRLLRALAQRCRELTRRCDIVGRMTAGGFMIYLPGAPAEIGRNIAHRLGQDLQLHTRNHSIHAGVSVVMMPTGGLLDVDALIRSGMRFISKVKFERKRAAVVESLKVA